MKRRHMRDVVDWLGLPWHHEGEDLFLLWTYGGYDGTCSGVCLVDDVPHYYRCINSVDAQNRIFAVARLTPEQFLMDLKYILKREEFTGSYEMYYYIDGKRKSGARYPNMMGVMSKAYFAAMDELKALNLPRVSWGNLTATGAWIW